MKNKCAIYVRTASTPQSGENNVLKEQVTTCKYKAKNKGYKVYEVLADAGIGGLMENRPGLDRLMELVDNEEIQVVVVTTPDRLSRNVSQYLKLMDKFQQNGVELIYK